MFVISEVLDGDDGPSENMCFELCFLEFQWILVWTTLSDDDCCVCAAADWTQGCWLWPHTVSCSGYICCSVALSILNHCCLKISLHIYSWVCVRLGRAYRCTCAVWVCLVCHNNVHRLCGLSSRHLFSHSSGDSRSEIRVLAWWGVVRTLFLARGWSPSHCVLIRQRYIASKIFDVCCYRGNNSVMRDPPLWPHLT